MNNVPSRHRTALRTARLAIGILALLFLPACADSAQDSLKPAGDWARKLDSLWDISFIAATVVFVLVEALLVYALIRFRARGPDDAPKQIHGSTPLEIGWTILPALILTVLAVPTVATIWELAEEPKDALEITVTGHQWWWEYDYDDLGVETANELHIPEDKHVNVTLKSFDVIHSFWAPQLFGKVDVVPGRANRLAMEADNPGVYLGQCAEFCGLSHANMRLRVIVHTADDFARWVAAQKEESSTPAAGGGDGPGDPAAGHALMSEKGCFGCHTVAGHEDSGGANVGPNLTHLMDRTTFAGGIFDLTEENLRRWLADPPKMKPMQPGDGIGMPATFPPGADGKRLTEQEIDDLVAYLETLE